MVEQKLDIVEKGEYKNIDLRKLDNDNHIIVEKLFLECREQKATGRDGSSYTFFPTIVKYGEDEVGMVLPKEEVAKEFADIAGVGDKVKITLQKEMYVDKKGKDRVAKKYLFEKVE